MNAFLCPPDGADLLLLPASWETTTVIRTGMTTGTGGGVVIIRAGAGVVLSVLSSGICYLLYNRYPAHEPDGQDMYLAPMVILVLQWTGAVNGVMNYTYDATPC